MTTGDALEVLGNQPGRLYSLRGSRRVSSSVVTPVTLFSALIIEPSAETRGSGSGVETSCLKATAILTWKLGHWKTGPFNLPDQKLVMRFNGDNGRVTIADRQFETTRGNCFVVHLDPGWQASVSQTPLQYTDPTDIAAIATFLRSHAQPGSDLAVFKLYSEVHPSSTRQ